MSKPLTYSKKEWAIAIALECILMEAGADTALDITLEHTGVTTLEAIRSESLESQRIYYVEVTYKSIDGKNKWCVGPVRIKYLNKATGTYIHC